MRGESFSKFRANLLVAAPSFIMPQVADMDFLFANIDFLSDDRLEIGYREYGNCCRAKICLFSEVRFSRFSSTGRTGWLSSGNRLSTVTYDRRRSVMAEFTAKTLVLRGATVLNDGKADWLRLGSRYPVQVQAPRIPFSMREASQGCPFTSTEPGPRHDHVDNPDVAAAATRAGRSERLADVLRRRRFAMLRSMASSAGLSATHKRPDGKRWPSSSKGIEVGLMSLPAISRMYATSTRGRGAR
jgi:hypothetical protein